LQHAATLRKGKLKQSCDAKAVAISMDAEISISDRQDMVIKDCGSY